jgi:hypothetical protein
MAMIPADAGRACIPKSNPPKPYVLSFSKGQYYVPAAAVVSYPKKPNRVSDGTKLGEILFTKAPSAWKNYCDPDTLMHIKGNDGSSCVYTTFAVEGHDDEQRFLRFISGSIAAKNFPELKQLAEEKWKEDPSTAPANDRQRIRMAVLDWEKEKDCPNRAQLSPELNGWPQLGRDGGEELLKSCRVDPESKKRTKGSSDKRKRDEDDWFSMTCENGLNIKTKVIKVGPKGSYSIDEQPGFLLINKYEHDTDDKDGQIEDI